MNDWNNSPTNTSTRRLYHRRNRKGNRTTNGTYSYYFPVTTTITTSTTLAIESTRVPINDLFAWISSLFQYKNILVIILCLFALLCVISIIFIIAIWKCKQRKRGNKRRQGSFDRKRLENLPDFLDDHRDNDNQNEKDILLEPTKNTSAILTYPTLLNGNAQSDNISNTLSLDPMLEQKIIQNNQLSTSVSLPTADATSVDTLRGSLASTPSQQISTGQGPSTPTRLLPVTTTDSVVNDDEHVDDREKGDDLHDLDLSRIRPHFAKAVNSSSGNLATHRTSASSIEQTIRKREQNAEQQERHELHGSASNIYEKTIREQEIGRKPHTNSQVSLVSRTSEDSCY